MISVKQRLAAYVVSLEKDRERDRSQTVGASEIGSCARKTWFSKHGAERDAGYVESWGGRVRGHMIEEYLWAPAMRASLQPGEQLLYAYPEQKTLTSGYLSATTDGILIFSDGSCINFDCKSLDPRINLPAERPENKFQVIAQAGLIRETTEYKPNISHLTYINSSFLDDINEYYIPFSEKIYAQAHMRATTIMTSRDPLSLRPEGKLSGGKECKYCAWASRCADITAAGVPRAKVELSDNLAGELKALRDAAVASRENRDNAAEVHALDLDRIKNFLREINTRWYQGDGWSVSYASVNSKQTLDIRAVEEAGLDLSPYYKLGRPADRLTVK